MKATLGELKHVLWAPEPIHLGCGKGISYVCGHHLQSPFANGSQADAAAFKYESDPYQDACCAFAGVFFRHFGVWD